MDEVENNKQKIKIKIKIKVEVETLPDGEVKITAMDGCFVARSNGSCQVNPQFIIRHSLCHGMTGEQGLTLTVNPQFDQHPTVRNFLRMPQNRQISASV